ncbi:hypothetical protein AVEN_175822-1 [Araneus ventricosus]|uniref:Uncharacterized protein n=1 Tax=Araneus ventricosus TaxID=182803 RepID=A0A4Y2F3V4_ARAVE|nr:hypothetical protein AVEN_175822-1 [Araneus ventricosus]
MDGTNFYTHAIGVWAKASPIFYRKIFENQQGSLTEQVTCVPAQITNSLQTALKHGGQTKSDSSQRPSGKLPPTFLKYQYSLEYRVATFLILESPSSMFSYFDFSPTLLENSLFQGLKKQKE